MATIAARPVYAASLCIFLAACVRIEEQTPVAPMPSAQAAAPALPVSAASHHVVPARAAAAPPPVQASERRPPQCFDDGTIAGVLDLIHEQMLPGDAYRSIPRAHFLDYVYITAARPTRWDKDIARFECAGTLVVDASAGADPLGNAIITSPQALHAAGASVADVERELAASLSTDRQSFAYPLSFSTQMVGDQHYVEVVRVGGLRALLTGSFLVAHLSKQTGTDRAAATETPSK